MNELDKLMMLHGAQIELGGRNMHFIRSEEEISSDLSRFILNAYPLTNIK